jgi:hypothetical protein
MDNQLAVDNEFALLRSLLRSKGMMDTELDNHLKRVEVKVKSLVKP